EGLAALAHREARRARVVPERREEAGIRVEAADARSGRGLPVRRAEREIGLEKAAFLHHLLRGLAGGAARRPARRRAKDPLDGPLALELLQVLLRRTRPRRRLESGLDVLARSRRCRGRRLLSVRGGTEHESGGEKGRRFDEEFVL